ncbi:MAG: acyltransferase family protein [Muribaculaceae bacterium]|nr:acyltransferase family protein [Muribaculaceae bacterium]
MNRRDDNMDIAKAFGILLMILGHGNGLPALLLNFIFSFHMPLFFILSGYFFRPKPIRQVITGGLKRLVKPYLVTASLCVVICYLTVSPQAALDTLIGTFMANGSTPQAICFPSLPYIGPVWFLLALFWCRVYYTCIKRATGKTLLPAFLISTAAFLVGKYVINLPLGLLDGLCAIVFYAMGDYWKNRLKEPVKPVLLITGIIIWAACIWFGNMDVARFEFSPYPLSMIAAFVGTYVTYLVSCRMRDRLRSLLSWTGRNTLLILCYHMLLVYLPLNGIYTCLQQHGMTHMGIAGVIVHLILALGLTYLHTTIKRLVTHRG